MAQEKIRAQENLNQFLLGKAEIAVRSGAKLFAWWKASEAAGILKKFSLTGDTSSAASAVAFYDTLEFDGQQTSVMGCVQKLRFQKEKGAVTLPDCTFESFFNGQFLRRCTWTYPDGQPGGFRYRALEYKLNENAETGSFSGPAESEIPDLVELGKRYKWIVLRVDILDFVRSFPALKKHARFFSKFIKEAAYVVVDADYVCSVTPRPEGAVAQCCFGYSFLPCTVVPNFFGFGPGRFGTAIKQFQFTLLEAGELEAQLAFVVAPRSQKVLYLAGFDPIYTSIHLINALTFNRFRFEQRAHDRLDAFMLAHHVRVHQNLLEGMRETLESLDFMATHANQATQPQA